MGERSSQPYSSMQMSMRGKKGGTMGMKGDMRGRMKGKRGGTMGMRAMRGMRSMRVGMIV